MAKYEVIVGTSGAFRARIAVEAESEEAAEERALEIASDPHGNADWEPESIDHDDVEAYSCREMGKPRPRPFHTGPSTPGEEAARDQAR